MTFFDHLFPSKNANNPHFISYLKIVEFKCDSLSKTDLFVFFCAKLKV
ncbi:MAG: hypothetical protein RIS29_1026 [Bacteroidota bacterium]|jgi:hypothetical protein